MGYLTPVDRVTGERITAARWNQDVVANVIALANPPRFALRRAAAQSLTTATWTLISWDTEDRDTDNLWVVGSADRVTITTGGRYGFKLSCTFATNSTGLRQIAIATGVTVGVNLKALDVDDATASGPHGLSTSVELELAAAATVSFQAYQSSGGGLNIQDASATPVRVTGRYLGAI